jgi:hypothetical protein
MTGAIYIKRAPGLIFSNQIWHLIVFSGENNAFGIPQTENKLRGPSPEANYTDRATAACRRS